MNNLRTVSDTKRAFYSIHTRPVNSVYRRVVEELMVEMHLLRVNEDFRYDPIFALGVTTSFDRFMDGYQPENDKDAIFSAICKAQEADPVQMQKDGQRLTELAQSKSAQEMLDWITQAANSGGDELQWQLRNIAQNPKFKYSRLFAIGLFTLLELSEGNITQDEESLAEFLPNICTVLNISESKLQKDLEIYRGNLDKIAQVRQAMDDILEAQKKRREADQAKKEGSDDTPTTEASTPDSEPTSEVSS
ncbi:photosystem II biogenesis protein Psp29 [Acaryochloris sp. CCMEE 5410]|uniref:photosystem II biogenesis protein Psp29 n=1 Tax=Acaryochloris sp. CCMEE 5410 TaxID=310037 RepID=UPI00049409A3|nr:photosystem II biogenesis protein Psp29 [Acaryochloris sp. CCMEE 5410]KAI9132917.1 photosystem II biogenesis protein Psp29 [Acaryochloris sp. CCMEE 5410]